MGDPCCAKAATGAQTLVRSIAKRGSCRVHGSLGKPGNAARRDRRTPLHQSIPWLFSRFLLVMVNASALLAHKSLVRAIGRRASQPLHLHLRGDLLAHFCVASLRFVAARAAFRVCSTMMPCATPYGFSRASHDRACVSQCAVACVAVREFAYTLGPRTARSGTG